MWSWELRFDCDSLRFVVLAASCQAVEGVNVQCRILLCPGRYVIFYIRLSVLYRTWYMSCASTYLHSPSRLPQGGGGVVGCAPGCWSATTRVGVVCRSYYIQYATT